MRIKCICHHITFYIPPIVILYIRIGYMYIFDTCTKNSQHPVIKMAMKEGEQFLLLVFYTCTMFFMDLYTPARSKEDCTDLTCSNNNCSELHNVDHSTVNSALLSVCILLSLAIRYSTPGHQVQYAYVG